MVEEKDVLNKELEVVENSDDTDDLSELSELEVEEESEIEEKENKKEKTEVKKGRKKKNEPVRDFKSMFWGLGGEIIPTGIHAFDLILGGGYERGDIIEVYGNSCLGKTTMILDICRRAYKKGLSIAYIDVETAVKGKLLTNMGVDLSDVGPVAGKHRFFMASPQNFKELEDLLRVLLRELENPYDIVVIDSLSDVDQYREDLSITNKDLGLRARQESVFFSEFKSDFRRSGTTCFIVNQMRTKFKGSAQFMVAYEDSTGGKSSKHNYDVRVIIEPGMGKLVRKESTILGSTKEKGGEKSDNKTVYGCVSSMKSGKNRNERPEIPVNLHVIYGMGISNVMFLDDVLSRFDFYVIKSGGWWEFDEIPDFPELSKKRGQGKVELWALIKENEDRIVTFLKDTGKWSLTLGC